MEKTRNHNRLPSGKYAPSYKPYEERFWGHVDKSGECWTWLGYRESKGYGIAHDESNRAVRAHRLAWIMTNGPVPDGLYVCHKCDNPSCVRPDHLFTGTQTDNMQDCIRKGRGTLGRKFGKRQLAKKGGEDFG